MSQLRILQLIAQVSVSQPTNPLINRSGEDWIYIGVGGLTILSILILGLLSRRIAAAISMSLALSTVIILLVFIV